MKYSEATPGTLLKALISGLHCGVSMQTMLKKFKDRQAEEPWDQLAERLLEQFGANMIQWRKERMEAHLKDKSVQG